MANHSMRDLCGACCIYDIAHYGGAELFIDLIGTGASRSVYELTAHDQASGGLLFDLRVEASTSALEQRARPAQSDPDAQAVSLGLNWSKRILDSKSYASSKHFRLFLDDSGETLLDSNSPGRDQATWRKGKVHG